jgi:alpha-1,6-mannosyltransferase
MLSVLDINDFWSPSGGGVRRYHLEKIERFQQWEDVRYAFVMPDGHRRTEVLNATTVIEHVPAFKFPGNWDYRLLLRSSVLREVIIRHRPDIIEIGSPYIAPWLVQKALQDLDFRPKIVGFWHADFPVTYIGRFFQKFGNGAGTLAETLAWKYARRVYHRMDATWVASRFIQERMKKRGLRNLHYVPLGVDTQTFRPENRDEALLTDCKAGLPERAVIFFGHRFCEEKGLRTFLEAYPLLCRKLGHEPAVIFVGTGPDLDRVQAAVQQNSHMRYLGYVRDPREMARLYASCEVCLMLSGWETFGLAVLEAMASGQCVVGADQGGTREHVEASGAGVTFRVGNSLSLAEAIHQLIQMKDLENRRQQARAYAESLGWDACFEREKSLYHSLVNGNPRA